MPILGENTPVLDGLRHVHTNPQEQAWFVGLNQPQAIVKLGVTLDEEAYDIFQDSVPPPRHNYMATPGDIVESYYASYTRSSIDIMTTHTANRLGVLQSSLIQPSLEGMVLFEVAGMPLKGALFGKWSYYNPITQSATSTSSMIYVADCENNHVSTGTVEAFQVRKDNTMGRMNPLYVPMNI